MKVNAAAAIIYALLAVGASYVVAPAETSTQERRDTFVVRGSVNPLPDAGLIDDLDRAIQARFLTTQNFGMRRIGPQPNPHFDEEFTPATTEEQRAVTNLQAGRWKVGVYLFGRRAYERVLGKDEAGRKRLYVEHRLNRALPITKNTKRRHLADPKRLRDGVAEAFYRFKETDSYTFEAGKWSYVARPVKAIDSCLKCHTDLFVTIKPGEKKYAYRGRRAGDPIGVLVYAFANSQ